MVTDLNKSKISMRKSVKPGVDGGSRRENIEYPIRRESPYKFAKSGEKIVIGPEGLHDLGYSFFFFLSWTKKVLFRKTGAFLRQKKVYTCICP